MENPARILIIRLTAIGDVVLTLPAVSVLRQNFPAAKISFLTTSENASLLQGFRDVDETVALDRAAFRSGNPWRMGKEFLQLLRRLRAEKFSLAVDLQSNGESAWLTRLTGAAQRWGVVHKPGRRHAFTHRMDRRRGIHAAEMHLELLRHGGLKIDAARNEFFLPADALATAREFFLTHRLAPEKPTLFVQPFTSATHKNWPLENYLAVARHCRAQGVQIILGGGPDDRIRLAAGRQEGFAVSAGVPLLVTGGLMQLSTLVLGGDTGALHLAVALGRKVLMLMHRKVPGSPAPYQHSDWTLSAPEKLTIAELPVATVVARCEAMLG